MAIALLLAALLVTSRLASAAVGQVLDAGTGLPIPAAQVTIDDEVALTDAYGVFRSTRIGDTVHVRAPGYRRVDVATRALATPVRLVPFSPKAVYLSTFGIGTKALRTQALELIETTELNAVVIDVKGDRGLVSYRSAVTLATEIGAQAIITITDVRALLAELKQKGIYTIARIVVYKDNPLAEHRRDLAVKAGVGRLWRDREDLAWTDPFRREVWDYNVALAIEAAAHGFDEIQFDYVRFPDAEGLAYAQTSTATSRMRAIEGFLAEARRRLVPYNVFLAADVFGYVCWNLDDTEIGQKLETLVAHLDYISPMLYPSSFQFGIPGYANPVAHPYEIVFQTLGRARDRTGLPPARFRPWLQAFRDYAFDRRPFGAAEIRAQINAADRFGSNGWMLWNPRNVYSREGLTGRSRARPSSQPPRQPGAAKSPARAWAGPSTRLGRERDRHEVSQARRPAAVASRHRECVLRPLDRRSGRRGPGAGIQSLVSTLQRAPGRAPARGRGAPAGFSPSRSLSTRARRYSLTDRRAAGSAITSVARSCVSDSCPH